MHLLVSCAKLQLHLQQIANSSSIEERLRLDKERRRDALRTHLNKILASLHRPHHRLAVGNAVRHRLLAIHILARRDRVHGDLFMPVVGHSHNDSLNILVIQNFLVASCGADIRTGNLLRKRVPTVIEIACCHTLALWQSDRGTKQRRTLDANADRRKSNPLAGWLRCRSLFGCQDEVAAGNHGG